MTATGVIVSLPLPLSPHAYNSVLISFYVYTIVFPQTDVYDQRVTLLLLWPLARTTHNFPCRSLQCYKIKEVYDVGTDVTTTTLNTSARTGLCSDLFKDLHMFPYLPCHYFVIIQDLINTRTNYYSYCYLKYVAWPPITLAYSSRLVISASQTVLLDWYAALQVTFTCQLWRGGDTGHDRNTKPMRHVEAARYVIKEPTGAGPLSLVPLACVSPGSAFGVQATVAACHDQFHSSKPP